MRAWFRTHGAESALTKRICAAVRETGVILDPCSGEDEPEGNGLLIFDRVDEELCASIKRDSCGGLNRIVAVALSERCLSRGTAWRLLAAGAADSFAWESQPAAAATIAARFERYEQVDGLIESEAVRNQLAGMSSTWIQVLRQIVEVAAFSSASVLITGESGTGKELIARLIHALDGRATKGRFVVLDCTTVSPELSGSEFFGHERGAFTTAIASRDGAFALAEGGTLFLDEVGELPLRMQAELLRVIQERVYKRVGSNSWKHANFRLVCATNRNLQDEEKRGAFRRDFYHRIASWTCELPSLTFRREDIIPLTCHFLRQILPAGVRIPRLDVPVRDYLLTREYPGNIRELRQLIVRMMSRHVGDGPITVGDLPPEERMTAISRADVDWHDGAFEGAIRRALAMGLGLREINSQTAEVVVRTAINDEGGNLRRAANRLGVTDRALQLRRAVRRREPGRRGVSEEDGLFSANGAPEGATDLSTGE